MPAARSKESLLAMPDAKLRVGLCISSFFFLVVLTLGNCGQPRGHAHTPFNPPKGLDDPFYWWLKPTISSDRGTIPEVFGANLPQSPLEPIGPPDLCQVDDVNTEKANDIIIAYQYWMGPGYSTADFLVRRNRQTSFEVIISPHGFPRESCESGMLSEKTLREFYELVEKLQVCEDPPRPTWENVGIEPLCVRKGNATCLIGLGNDDPKIRLLRMAIARLAIYGCTSKLSVPTGPT